MLKNLTTLILLILSSSLGAQVKFRGKARAITQINSEKGQNYFIISSTSNNLAYTQEGTNLPKPFEEVRFLLDSIPYRAIVFNDDLNEKGMSSPIGYISKKELIYSEVVYEKGIYKSSIKILNLENGESQTINTPFFKSIGSIQSGCLSTKKDFILLSLETIRNNGVEDLYVLKKKLNGTWSSPINLGSTINSKFQEITPFLAEDNQTLFFASNRKGGKGSFDIYSSKRLDNSWRSWSKPKLLEGALNTSGSESSFFFQKDSNWAFFVRAQDSDGYGDIFRIRIEKDIPLDTISLDKQEELTIKVEDLPTITLEVVDAQSGSAISATMISSRDTLTNTNGLFQVESLDSREVEIKSTGYLPKLIRLDSTLAKGKSTIELHSIAKGETINLENVLFLRGTSNLVLGSEEELNLVVEVMMDNPNLKILLKGHTDNTGDQVRNVKLSEARVRTVKEYILSKGISAYRVIGKGFGGIQPIASNETEETRKLNRRVEFEILEN